METDFSDGKYLSFLATVDEEGRPHVRPVIGIFAGRKIYFSTREGAKKTKEMALNPPVELLVPGQGDDGLSYIRFSGEAFRIFDENLIRETLTRFSYSPDAFVYMEADETISMYELIPVRVDAYFPDKKREQDVTKRFFATEGP